MERTFRHRHKTPIGTGRVIRQPADLLIVEAAHRFGHQTTTALFQALHPLYTSYRAFQHRVELLRQLENSEYGGPLLYAPSQQVRAVRPDSNHLVIGITQRGERLLKNAGRWREHHPKTKNKEWKHDFMRSTIIASIAIAAKANGCTFTYPDEVVADMDGRLSFEVPPYEYRMEKNNELRTKEDAMLRPDGFFALTYENRTKRIFIVEADCDTEPDRSDNTERKSHKHNILAYHALLSDGDLRRTYFGEAWVGVLNVFSVERAMTTAMDVHEEEIGSRGSYMLYQTWDSFGDFFRPPPPRPSLFLNSWQRVGRPPAFISKAPEAELQPRRSPLSPIMLATA
jgi:hypothetical protein